MSFPFSFNGGDVPADVIAAIQEEHTRSMLKQVDHQNALDRIWSSMSSDDVVAMRKLFENMVLAGPERALVSAAYLEGTLAALLKFKFNVCPGCGIDHDAEGMEAVMAEHSDVAVPKATNFIPTVFYDGKEEDDDEIVNDSLPEASANGVGFISELDKQRMTEYGLDDLRDQDTHDLLGFICLNCKYTYPSIEDRMLRPPGKEGCTGCIEKEKWG